MSTGYPYLKISQKYNISYERILRAGDYALNFNYNNHMHYLMLPYEVQLAVRMAAAEFAAIRQGTRPFEERHSLP